VGVRGVGAIGSDVTGGHRTGSDVSHVTPKGIPFGTPIRNWKLGFPALFRVFSDMLCSTPRPRSIEELKTEKIWEIWKKSKLNSEKIWKNMEETQVE
jgi:hypothetical protein